MLNDALTTAEKYKQMHEIFISYEDFQIEYLKTSQALFEGQTIEWSKDFDLPQEDVKEYLIGLIGGPSPRNYIVDELFADRKTKIPTLEDSPWNNQLTRRFLASDFMGKINMGTVGSQIDCPTCQFFIETNCHNLGVSDPISTFSSKGELYKTMGVTRQTGTVHLKHLQDAGLVTLKNKMRGKIQPIEVDLKEFVECTTPENRLAIWYGIIIDYYPELAENLDPNHVYPTAASYYKNLGLEKCSFNDLAIMDNPRILFSQEWLDAVYADMTGVKI